MRPRWLRPVRITGAVLAGVCLVGSGVLFPFVGYDPAPGTTKSVPTWIAYLDGVMALGTVLGLALILISAVVQVWPGLRSRLRWRLRHWRETGSPFLSAVERARRPRPR